MSKYSNKIIKTELNSQIIKAVKLQPITASVETMKLAKTLLPSLGSLGDAVFSKDRSLTFATCLNLFAQNAIIDHFEQMQELLLGSILDSNDGTLSTPEKINAWLESHEAISQYDLMYWLFKENLLQPLLDSQLVQSHMDKLITVKDMFNGMFVELPDVALTQEVVSEMTPEVDEDEAEKA